MDTRKDGHSRKIFLYAESLNRGKTIVFAEPINATAEDVFAQLDINTKTKNPKWIVDKTVLSLTVDGVIANGTKIQYTKTSAIKTTSGDVVGDAAAVIAGNFDGAERLVTATSMTATIVKGTPFKPEVQDADSIVLVFNAPVAATGNISITAGTEILTAVADATKTIYTIDLDGSENLEEVAEVAYGSMTAALQGSFGKAVAPKVLKAVAVDNDGTALTTGDSIMIYFDQNTNTPTTGVLAGNLKDAVYEWVNAQTLKITLGNTAISKTDMLDISSLAIKDCYGLISATGLENITLEGGFGMAIKPEIARVSAVSVTGNPTATQGDKIVIAFNTLVNHDDVTDVSVFDGNLGNGFDIKWQDAETTVAIITIGAGSPKIDVGTTSIRFVGEIWDVTHTVKMSEADHIVSHGAWGITITPELMSATIVKSSNKPTAQAGDKIVLVFTTPTNGVNVIPLLQDELSNATGVWSANNTIYTITLAANTEITDSSSIEFDNVDTVNGLKAPLKDIYGVSVVEDKTVALKGSFGKANQPELLSATIVKTKTDVGAQAGDQIVLVFSAMTNGADNTQNPNIIGSLSEKLGTGAVGTWSTNGTVYTVTLGDNPTITEADNITLRETSDFKDVHNIVTVKGGTVNLVGSFGATPTEIPQIVSAIAFSKGNYDYIKVTFNIETNLGDAAFIIDDNFKNELKENNPELGNVTEITKTATTMTITLGEGATVKATNTEDADNSNDKMLNLSNLGIASKSSKTALAITTAPYSGYTVPVVKDIVAEDGGQIKITFTTRTNQASIDLESLAALYGEGATAAWPNAKTLVITLGTDYGITERGYISLDNLGIKDGYSGSYVVSGQYKIQSGSFTSDALEAKSAIAKSTTTTVTDAAIGDRITITFSYATDKNDDLANIISEVKSGDAVVTNPFGTGATCEWVTGQKLVITLGEAPEIKRDDVIYFNTANIKTLSGQVLTTSAVTLKGSFDGRDYFVSGNYIAQTATAKDHSFKVVVDNTSDAVAAKPTIVCVAYNGNTPVAISRVSAGIDETAEFVFTFSGSYTITNAKVYVFRGLLDDITDTEASPEVLAETKTIHK